MIARLGLLLFILLFRFYQLGLRPPHHDESVNGWFVDGIFTKGFYHYDPQNYHGPIFFYLITLFEMLFGRSLEVLRMPPVLFGIALTFVPLLFKRWITERGAWFAVFFLAVSPACVFFSRYTIHETGFALGCAVFLYFWFRARTEGLSWKMTLGLGLSLGFIAGMKENFVIYVASLGLAEVIVQFMPVLLKWTAPNTAPFQMMKWPEENKGKPSPYHFLLNGLAVIGIAFLVILASYTALGRDPEGILNFFRAFTFWSETGSKGNGHQKPFLYWISLLFNYEWLAFLGLVLSVLALKKVKTEIRILSALGFGLWLAYSIVNYKTPWCVLSFYFLLIMIACYWLSVLSTKKNWKGPVFILFGLGLIFSATQAYDVSYVDVDSDHHPYIYGQTYRTLMPPLNAILERVKEHPELKATLRIQVISKFTWPLPWILGEIKQVGYHTEQNPPAALDADYLLIDDDLEPVFRSRIKGDYSRAVYPARQWAHPMVIYTKK